MRLPQANLGLLTQLQFRSPQSQGFLQISCFRFGHRSNDAGIERRQSKNKDRPCRLKKDTSPL
jgi:hypothetical protein